MAKLPYLKADTDTLFRLYHDNQIVDSGDIKRAFNCCGTTARKALLQVGRASGTPPNTLRVSVDALFRAYGWDINKINRSVKLMGKDVAKNGL